MSAVLHCVYYWDRHIEDFEIAGVFSKLEDAEVCKASIDVEVAAIVERSIGGLKADLLQRAIDAASKLPPQVLQRLADLSMEKVPDNDAMQRTLFGPGGFPVAAGNLKAES